MRHQLPVTVPTIEKSMARLLDLPADIKLIREKEQLGLTQMARSLGVSKVGLWRWQTGKRTPREPLIILCIFSWADKLKQGEEPL